MTERFNRAINALYKGFFEGTLVKGSCHACAVGNIVAECQGSEIKEINSIQYGRHLLSYPSAAFWSDARDNHNTAVERRLKELTGYTASQLLRIERIFENVTKIHWQGYYLHSEQEILEDQYNGLVAVFDLLMELDNVMGDEYKAKLKAHPKLVLA